MEAIKYNAKGYFSFLILVVLSTFLIYCSSPEEEIIEKEETYITKNSTLVSLIKNVVAEDGEGQQCINYKYPLNFLLKRENENHYNLIRIISDDDLQSFFNNITNKDRLNIDFPMSLIDDDNEETIITTFETLESTLDIILDACVGNNNYDYCDANNKKVFICHNGQTICISINALKAHLDHGDIVGQCP